MKCIHCYIENESGAHICSKCGYPPQDFLLILASREEIEMTYRFNPISPWEVFIKCMNRATGAEVWVSSQDVNFVGKYR
jgi:hypothetical protein